MGVGVKINLQGMPLHVAHAALESRGLRAIKSFWLKWIEIRGSTLGCREIGDSR